MNKQQSHFVSFYTDGDDEGCFNLKHMAEHFAHLAKSEGMIDTLHLFCPKDLVEMGEAWAVHQYPDTDALERNINPTYHKFGLGAWAFVIIKSVLSRASIGDLVVYHNINIEKYPYYKETASILKPYAEAVLAFFKKDIHGIVSDEVIGSTCNYDVLTKVCGLNKNNNHPDFVANVYMQHFNFMAIRVTEKTRKFFADIVCAIKTAPRELLGPNGSQYRTNMMQPCGVILHRHTADQAIFNSFFSAQCDYARSPPWYLRFIQNCPEEWTSLLHKPKSIFGFLKSTMFTGQTLDEIYRPFLYSADDRFRLHFDDDGIYIVDQIKKSQRTAATPISEEHPISKEEEDVIDYDNNSSSGLLLYFKGRSISIVNVQNKTRQYFAGGNGIDAKCPFILILDLNGVAYVYDEKYICKMVL